MANHWGQCLYCRQRICSHLRIWWFGQESLPIFQRLAEVSKLLEGENYVLSSTYWGALFDVEEVIAHHPEYSAPISALRQVMHDDNFSKRATLEKSLSNVLHVLMALLDPRYINLYSFFFSVMHPSCFVCRWRVHRAVKLTVDQWNRVKALFLRIVPQFFPNNCLLPVFIPLNGTVFTKLEEIQQELEELQHDMERPGPAAA